MKIFGDTEVTPFQVGAWASSKGAAGVFINEMLPALWEVALETGINPLVMVAQSAHETAYGHFGRAVTRLHFNTCGLKVRNPIGPDFRPDDHARFANWEVGALAHSQHLRGYAEGRHSVKDHLIVDPRLHLLPVVGVWSVEELGGKWAPDPDYGKNIVRKVEAIQGFAGRE